MTTNDDGGEMPTLFGEMNLIVEGDQTVALHPMDHLVDTGAAHSQPVGDSGLDHRNTKFLDLPDRLCVLTVAAVIRHYVGIVTLFPSFGSSRPVYDAAFPSIRGADPVKLPDELAKAFNDQVTMELASSVAYLQMAAHFENENLIGMAAWMRIQADEELVHAHRFIKFVLDRDNPVVIGTIEAPRSEYTTVESVFETSLAQEQKVTASIHEIYRLAVEKSDYASFPILQAFIEEQNEEEATVLTILERLRLAGGESSAILLLDNELGARVPEA